MQQSAGPTITWWQERFEGLNRHMTVSECFQSAPVSAAILSFISHTKKRKFDPISDDIRDKLHWLPVEQRIQFKIGVLVYRCLHGNAPSYLSEMLTAAADVSGRRSLRSAARGDLVIPRTRTLGYGSRMFAVSGPSFWNSLPLGLRDINLTESVFRRQLKTLLFRNAYGINLLV